MPVKSHDQCRKGVCFFCRKKADRELNQSLINYIISNVFPDFKDHQEYLPGGSCLNCRRKVANKESFPPYDYDRIITELKALKTLRGVVCSCTLCKIFKGVKNTHVAPAASVASVAPPIPYICVTCYAKVTTSHDEHQKVCNKSQAQKIENLSKSVSPNTKARFTSTCLKSMEADESGKVLLPTAGRPMPVYLGARKKEKAQVVPIQTFLDFQKERPHLSNRDVLGAAKVWRKQHGRRSVEKGLAETLPELPRQLLQFFSYTEEEFLYRGKMEKRGVVYCHDVNGFVLFLAEERNIDLDNYFVRIGMDSGGGSFKVTMNLVRKHSAPSNPAKKQKTDPKDSGEKRLMILALIPKISENYQNMTTVLSFLDLSSLASSIRYAMDLKMIHILLGIQAHGSTFPCCFCTWRFGTRGEEFFKRVNYQPNPIPQPRTLGNQRMMATALQNATGPRKDPKCFYSTILQPLVIGANFELVMNRISPPELHLFTGIVNHIINHLNDRWGDDLLINWLKANKLEKGEFDFNGKQCNKFLDDLLPNLEQKIPLQYYKYITALQAFRTVKKSCFSEELNPNTRQIVRNFEKAYYAAGMTEFPKMHILCAHVVDFCEKENIGMASFSEQASETVHYKFLDIEKRYPGEMLEAVLKYNSQHE